MSLFGARLRRVAEELDLPAGTRIRILEEVSGDLDGLYRELIEQGLSPAQARRRAESLMAPSSEAAQALERLHRPLPVRWAERFSDRARHGLERTLLGLMTALALVLSLAGLARGGLLRDPSVFLWPILGLAGLLALLAAVRAAAWWMGGVVDRAQWRRDLAALLLVPMLSLLLAALGTVVELAEAAGRIQGDVAVQRAALMAWLFRSAGLWWCALITALAAGLIWLLLAGRAAAVERRETRLLQGLTATPRDSHEPRGR